ncbi:hypothetical protein [Mycobacterium sp. TY814]|uniref:hypothetical protein n=1 Tax=unclassified Mycobacterium TaxID=2642494 RepID=UPI0027413741|nr:hypothetical protein [Mycobacterium sp. TY814]MDP7724301.1 hypothetical protein [Mycobacterium sp. TY814]
MQGDPLPSISEADATGRVADLYDDIRKTLGMSFVNLVWRHLASIPDGLEWTWATMKPLFANGTVYSEADALRAAPDLPPVPRFSTAALRAVGIDADQEMAIRATLSGYDRGNPLNTVAFCAVLARLNGSTPSPCPPVRPPSRAPSALPVPPPLNFDQMPTHVAELVRSVNLIGARGQEQTLQVSLPRNLARWPSMLVLYYAALQPLHDSGSLLTAVDCVVDDARRRGVTVSGALGRTGLPEPATTAAVRASLEQLIPHAMGRMIPVVSLLLRMLPAGPQEKIR